MSNEQAALGGDANLVAFKNLCSGELVGDSLLEICWADLMQAEACKSPSLLSERQLVVEPSRAPMLHY